MTGNTVDSFECTTSMKAAVERLNKAVEVNKVKIDTVLRGALLFAGTCEHGTDGQPQSIKKKKSMQESESVL